jgi:transposase
LIPANLRILVATQPIDMRRSIDGLVAAVAERLSQDAAKERAIYVFTNAGKDRAKLVWRNAHQWCLFYTKLDGGYRVTIPIAADGTASVTVDARTLAAILDGMKKHAPPREIVREARAKVEIPSPTSRTKR